MDRLITRVLECRKIVSILQELVQNIIPDTDVQQKYTVPETGSGKGLHDTCRGALGHWVTIDNSLISSYQIISPSTWNLSPQGPDINGVSEQALIGTHIRDIEHPVEIVRIVRSFDPCVSCATHVYKDGKHFNTIQII
jgi:hydrogenase large subunit